MKTTATLLLLTLLAACDADAYMPPEQPDAGHAPLATPELYDLQWSPLAPVAEGCDLDLPTLLVLSGPESTGYQDEVCTSWGVAAVITRDEGMLELSGAQVAGCDDRVARIGGVALEVTKEGRWLAGDVEVTSGACRSSYHLRGYAHQDAP